eukprot:TRINITY_DN26157_c0_g1_i1.p1 TRINITY_DN26157_c0_g1~~TRINITY_DN26157_c0_g1_i1.p1  ORF type:complete len:291 (+),score=29.35 TRINITY_DN26157_c0_g1_i1:206-1078(+)
MDGLLESDMSPFIDGKPVVWAHRGASMKAPENTLASFRQALQDGADGVELDVHLSRDGHIIVIHDHDVRRTTDGSGNISDLSLEEIIRLDAGSKYSAKFAGERVPTLQNVLSLVLNWPTPRRVLIELKGSFSGLPTPIRLMLRCFRVGSPSYANLPSSIAAALAPYSAEVDAGRVIVQSFHKPYLDELRNLAPSLSLVYLSISSSAGWLEAEDIQGSSLGFSGVAIRHASLSEEGMARIRAHHRLVFAWTVDSDAALRRVCNLKVGGIITNVPDIAVKIVAEESTRNVSR